MEQPEVDQGQHYGHVTGTAIMGPTLGAMLCSHHLEILNDFKHRVLHFPAALDSANYVANPEI